MVEYYESLPNFDDSRDLAQVINQPDVVFAQQVLNTLLRLPGGDRSQSILDDVKRTLRQIGGRDYSGGGAIVSGLGYPAAAIADPIESGVQFDQDRLIYMGPSVQPLAGLTQIVYEFIDVDQLYAADDEQAATYYMLPEDITRLEVSLYSKLVDTIATNLAQSHDRLMDPGFLGADHAQQQQIMTDLVDKFNQSTADYYGQTFRVQALRYIGQSRDRNWGRLLAQSIFDQPDSPSSEQIEVVGRYIGSMWPETVDDPERLFRSVLDDFPLSHGCPSMLFWNGDNKISFIVAVSDIISLNQLGDVAEES